MLSDPYRLGLRVVGQIPELGLSSVGIGGVNDVTPVKSDIGHLHGKHIIPWFSRQVLASHVNDDRSLDRVALVVPNSLLGESARPLDSLAQVVLPEVLVAVEIGP